MITNKDLKRRIIEISYKNKLAHIGSCLTAVDIIEEIYKIKKSDEKFVLSSGHAGVALYCVIEKYTDNGYVHYAQDIYDHHGVHPDRCEQCGIDCSSGSLGHGISIAVGMALADRSKNVYCLLSDGEMAEGSVWEALRIWREQDLDNLKIYVNNNGYGAYRETPPALYEQLLFYLPGIEVRETNMNDYPEYLTGQQAHYTVLSAGQYKEVIKLLL